MRREINEMGKLFEEATRKKMRFNYRGLISVEDLWDLPVEALDSVYMELKAANKEASEGSLLVTKNKESELNGKKMDIIEYMVKTKLAEKAEKLEAQKKRVKQQKIREILEGKENEELVNMSSEELTKMLEELSK